MSPDAAATEGIPAEVLSFLASLARALQRYGLYPPGHPALADVADHLHEELAPLLAAAGQIELAVAPDRLMFEGTWTEPGAAHLSGLAARLHDHDLAALGLEPGATPSELGALLTALREKPATDADRLGRRAGMAARWPHVWVEPRHYERLALEEAMPDEPGELRDRRAARLWLGLARASGVAGTDGASEHDAANDGEPAAEWETPEVLAAARQVDPELVARALRELREAGALRRVGDAMLEAADDLESVPASFDLRERFGGLFRALGRGEIRRLLEGGMGSAQRRHLLDRAGSWLPVQALVDMVDVSSDLGDVDMSHWMLRILVKLARHAEDEDALTTPEAEQALRSQVRRAVVGWNADAEAFDEAYGEALRMMSETGDVGALPRGGEDGAPDPLRVLRTAAEVDRLGAAGEGAYRTLREASRLAELLEVADGADEGGEVAEALWSRLASEDVVRALAAREPPHLEGLERLARRIPGTVAEPLLDILVGAQDQSVRGRAFAILTEMGQDAAGLVASHLQDERWYVQRNMLALLFEMGAPRGFSARPFAAHGHVQVRREAYKHLLRDPRTREEGVRMTLRESEPRTLLLGLAAVEKLEAPDPGLAGLAARHARNEDLPDETRTQAVRALAHMGGSTARHALLRLARRRHPILFWRHRLAPPGRVSREAVAALARGWPRDVAVQRVLRQAAESEDAGLREAALSAAPAAERERAP